MRLTEVGQLACQTLPICVNLGMYVIFESLCVYRPRGYKKKQVAQVIQKKVEASFLEFEENGKSELSLASNDICSLKNTV